MSKTFIYCCDATKIALYIFMLMKAIGKFFLIIIVLEVSLGGGGRLFDTGPFTLRMVLFGLGLLYSVAIFLSREKIPREFVFLSGLFVALSCFSLLISSLNNQPFSAALRDFKPLAYFLLLPFFASTIRSVHDVITVSRVLRLSALVLAVLYLIVLAIWKSGLVTTVQMYEWLNPAHSAQAEFLFRGDTTFFFKAVLYVGVGVFFFVSEKNLSGKSAVLLLLLAIALTMTRGMWLSVFMVLAAWAFFCTGDRRKGLALAAGLLLVGVMGIVGINETLPSVAQSNAIRMNDLKMLADTLPSMAQSNAIRENEPKTQWYWQTVLFGRGLGASVLGRETIEITYANVLFKQGMLGIVFWLLPAAYLIWRVRNIIHPRLRALAMPYFMAAAFVYVVSLTNPFLTNPIGMAVVMIAMVAVRVIERLGGAELLESAPRSVSLGVAQI